MVKILWNDQFVQEEDVKIGYEDRGYQFGDGIYEVIKIYNGDMFTATEHIDRLYASADKIQLVIPYTKDVMHKMLHDLIEMNELQDGQVYLQVTRGSSMRQHNFPVPSVESVLTAYTKETARPLTQLENGVKACFVEDVRWLRCDIKTLNLLPNVLSKQKAVEQGAIEAILHRGETVTEGSASNVFIVKKGALYTHPANNYILNGITRMKVLELCDRLGLDVHEETFTVDGLLLADEVFITATKLDVIPILQVDDHRIGEGSPGIVTKRILTAFRSTIEKLEKQYEA